MTSLFAVFRQALRYRFNVAAVVVCALMVGICWSAHIGTVFPVLKLVLYGKSISASLEDKLRELESAEAQMKSEQSEPGDEIITGSPNVTPAQADNSAELAAIEAMIATQRWRVQLAKRWLPERPLPTMFVIVLALLVVTLVKGIGMATHEILVASLVNRVLFDMRAQLYRHSLRMDTESIESDRASKLMAYFTHHIDMIRGGLAAFFGPLLREPIKIMFCLIGAAIISWQLLLISLAVAPLGLLAVKLASWGTHRATHESISAMNELYSHLAGSLGGIRVIKVFTLERSERRRFHRTSKNILSRVMRVARIRALIKPTAELVGFLVVAVGLMLGTYLVVNRPASLGGIGAHVQPLTPEALILFFLFLVGVTDPAHKLSGIAIQLRAANAAAQRIERLLAREPRVQEPEISVRVPRPCGDLVLDDVTFRYRKGKTVLQRIDLTVRQGECVALVGANGSGKSTLVQLIPRLYDPTSGAIRLGNTDLRQFRLRELRNRIGMVTQATMLFDDTVRNNICSGRPDATDLEIREAARLAQAHDFIVDTLPEKYETVVGEGCAFLSGGQAQRIALARTILRDPELLILDEPTSSADLEAEQAIMTAMKSFLHRRMTLLITHRPSLLELADRIVLLERGQLQVEASVEEFRVSTAPEVLAFLGHGDGGRAPRVAASEGGSHAG